MEYRRLGKAGAKVTALGLGCNSFGTWLDEKAAGKVVHAAIDMGINHFDTADSYSDGVSEEMLGRALKEKRADVFVATKVGNKGWGTMRPINQNPADKGASRYYLMKAVDASLRRLQMDHVDLLYIHNPDPTTPIEETLRTLDDLVRAGKVRYTGCCNFKPPQLSEAMDTAKGLNLNSFAVTQDLYNLLDRGIESLVPTLEKYGLGMIPYRPLRDGFLTGKYKRGMGLPKGSRYDLVPGRMSASLKEQFAADKSFDILEKLEAFAKERNHTVGELAIAWLLAHPWMPSVIAGVSKPEQLMANAKGAEWKLTPEEVAAVSAMS